MKKLLAILLTVTLCLSVWSPAVSAGRRQSHRWEGVAIGVGAAIVGSAILNSIYRQGPIEVNTYRPGNSCYFPPPVYEQSDYPPPERHHSGHWEVRKFWVAPVYEKVWNPPHYNRHSEWVPGQWIEIEKERGYWREERVWVSER